MKTKRFGEIALVFIALCGFATTTSLTIQGSRKLEPLLLVFCLFIPLFRAFRIAPKIQLPSGIRWCLVVGLITFLWLKHFFFFCTVPFSSILSFSLVFSLGEAVCILAVFELYRKRSETESTFLILYSFLVLACASYTTVTKFFLPFLAVYSFALVALNRLKFYRQTTQKMPSSLVAWKLVTIFFLGLSYLLALILEHYREPLNNWNPTASFQSNTQRSGFSPITKLGSKNIETSRDPVLRYFARAGIHWLRGKSFDFYDEKTSEWRLSTQQVKTLKPKKINNKNIFPLPYNATKEEFKISYSLINLQSKEIYLFAPLEASALELTENVPSINQEEILWTLPQPVGREIKIYQALHTKILKLSNKEKQKYLQLPKKSAVYFKKLSQEIVGSEVSSLKKIKKIENYLRENYPYKTNSAVRRGKDPIVDFLQQKAGAHCEMFASAFIMLARAQKIPTRYTAGYLAYEWNSFGKFLTVRSCDAHAWTEVYLPDKGWTTVDPTPPAEVQKMLQGYRGTAEKYKEYLSEQVRKFWTQLKTIFSQPKFIIEGIAFLLLLLIFYWQRKRSKQKRNTEKKEIPNEKVSTNIVQLRKLAEEFEAAITPIFRARKPFETMREYLKITSEQLALPQQSFEKELLNILEEALYNDKEPSQIALETLTKQLSEAKNRYTSQTTISNKG